MDTVAHLGGTAPPGLDPVRPPLPPEAPIDMQEQLLRAGPRAPASRLPSTPRTIVLRRVFVLFTTVALTAAAAWQMYLVVTVNVPTLLQVLELALYVVLFAWIAFSFVTALAGFFVVLSGDAPQLGIDPSAPLPELATRCALLVPTYNEAPARVMGRVVSISESIERTARQDHFDIFILSDTTDPETWIREEALFLALRKRSPARMFYRHRADNAGRKAGNIAEWVRRFGGVYETMIVLDADSLMTGDTLVRLVAAAERHLEVALIQTFPVIVNGDTLFARLQQFAGRAYGPLVAHGITWWHGSEGNYWGHNAVIRVRAFADTAGLPTLRGRKPFGGAIMSHDFVEAALLRRRDFAVHMAPALRGSYEESPPTLTDYAARDRRWCQGNLQHVALLPTKGLHWMSRLHLLTGIGSYVTAPLWLAFLLLGMLISLQAYFIRPEYFPPGFTLFPNWPTEDPVRAAWVFAGTMSLLLAPKVLGWLAILASGQRRRSFGGAFRALVSMLMETLISGLIAPVMMWRQSASVLQILSGRDAGWNAQRREAVLPLEAVLRGFSWPTIVGLVLAAAAYMVSLPLLLWMSPVIAGLLLAIPLAALTSGLGPGIALRRLGLLQIPEELDPPDVLVRANELAEALAAEMPADKSALALLLESRALLGAHRDMLPAPAPRRPGDVDVDLVIGLAKLEHWDDPKAGFAVLTPAEQRALLSNADALNRLEARWKAWGHQPSELRQG